MAEVVVVAHVVVSIVFVLGCCCYKIMSKNTLGMAMHAACILCRFPSLPEFTVLFSSQQQEQSLIQV